MIDNCTTGEPVDGEPRRWSEPVRIGEIIAVLRNAIEVRGKKTMQEGKTRTVVCGSLRKAG